MSISIRVLKFWMLFCCLYPSIKSVAQTSSTIVLISDSIRLTYLRVIAEEKGYRGAVVFLFRGSAGVKKTAVIPKNWFEDYIKTKYHIRQDSLNDFIYQSMLSNREFNLDDSLIVVPFFNSLTINEDSVAALRKMPFNELRHYYFEDGGRLKQEYLYKAMDLSYYFFTNCLYLDFQEFPRPVLDYRTWFSLWGEQWLNW